jgi:hypothetical protein
MHAKIRIVIGCVLLMALTAGAQEMADVQFFPGVARLAGAPPSQWVSDVTVYNPNGYDTTVGFQFLREKQEHEIFDILVPPHQQYQLAPGETRLFEDVLNTVFGITSDTKGGLLVTCLDDLMQGTSNGEDAVILATMRTYDVSSPVGTYGQTIPANNSVTNSSGWVSTVTGARNDDRFRSNIGVVNLSQESVSFAFQFKRSNGDVVVQNTRRMEALEVNQWSFDKLGVGSVEGPLTVEVWIDSWGSENDACLSFDEGGLEFFVYVSKVDSDTQDAEFMYAAPPPELDELECP